MAKKKQTKTKPDRLKPGAPSNYSNAQIYLDDLLPELYIAYRKAKADMFFERSQPVAKVFCDYEDDLEKNLKALAKRIAADDWSNDIGFIGNMLFIPKSLEPSEKNEDNETTVHLSMSNPDDAWKKFVREEKTVEVSFRPVADFTVDMHVISALWVNKVGEKYDACLSKHALGSRVRRLSGVDESGKPNTKYHKDVWQTFKPYFGAYKKWRDDGFQIIEQNLSLGKRLLTVTMDLAAFYHNIDASFLLDDNFLDASGFQRLHGRLSNESKQLTKSLVNAFTTWARLNPEFDETKPAGVPVGPASSRIIANCILAEFDRDVVTKLVPLYYARYVDDIFLVIEDTGQFTNHIEIIDFLCERLPQLQRQSKDSNELFISLPYIGKSQLLLQSKKQKFFLLNGEPGQDLLETIKAKLDEVASEWRLLPDLSELNSTPAAKALTAAKYSRDDADALRKADDLSIRRLGYALRLRSIKAIAQDLEPGEWRDIRFRFYTFSLDHVATPKRIFDLFGYIPQLFGVAISCKDWWYAKKLVNKIRKVFDSIKSNAANKTELDEFQWPQFFLFVNKTLIESLLQALPFPKLTPRDQEHVVEILELLKAMGSQPVELDIRQVEVLAKRLFCRDLALLPYKEHLFGDLGWSPLHLVPHLEKDGTAYSPTPKAFNEAVLDRRREEIAEFLNRANLPSQLMPILFPTRPLSPEEITICLPQCSKEPQLWKDLVNAIRGTWYRKEASEYAEREGVIKVGLPKSRSTPPKPTIYVTSFETDDESWSQAAANEPDLSLERYRRLTKLCLSIAGTIQQGSVANYVVFPELSIPRKWLLKIAAFFNKINASLIAGVEYRHFEEGIVSNEAFLFLTVNRLGYQSWSVFRQQKSVPALHEGRQLREAFELELRSESESLSSKWVYDHFGFEFGLLICSELTDIKFRQKFRGNVDSLFILSWNQDLDSFSSLVESAALDVHCYMVLVNNRKYGDSRIRIPSKENWERDMVRVKGGLMDYFVVEELDYQALRDFQSHKQSPSKPFKPIPEGFEPSLSRRVVPGGIHKKKK
ncbi:RNA-directed DNA polymerase [Mariniblastus sp.]|nr:RNA-directed DNA polymerase [Mariniblastus sp.]